MRPTAYKKAETFIGYLQRAVNADYDNYKASTSTAAVIIVQLINQLEASETRTSKGLLSSMSHLAQECLATLLSLCKSLLDY